MMGKIDVTIWKDKDEAIISISGLPSGLMCLGKALWRGVGAQYALEFEDYLLPPFLGGTVFTSLEINVTEGGVIVRAEDDTVIFSGSARVLRTLAREFRFFCFTSKSRELRKKSKLTSSSRLSIIDHLHIEHYGEGSILAAESEPLILYMLYPV